MVAALSVSRHGPASRSAARRKIAARSSYGSARHIGAARFAAATAAAASSSVALWVTPSTWRCRCGWTTSIAVAAAHPLTAVDGHGQLDPLGGELTQAALQAGPFAGCPARTWRPARCAVPAR